MKFVEEVMRRFKSYPFRQRLPAAAALICFYGWEFYRTRRLTRVEILIMVVTFVAAFLGRRSPPFWFLLGIGLGAVLGLIISYLHF